MKKLAEKREITRAAAGTGKTEALTKAYLECLRDGLQVREVVAITFTRKAAAELLERVGRVLWAIADDGSEQSNLARTKLGKDLERYVPFAPDAARAKQSLSSLGDAPVGTTDSFVARLLGEFALFASFPLPEGGAVPVDVPLADGRGDTQAIFEEEARRLLADPERKVDPEVQRLLEYFSLGELIREAAVQRPRAMAGAVPARFDEVYGALARTFVSGIEGGAGRLRRILIENLGLVRDPSDWRPRVEGWFTNKGLVFLDPVLEWLAGDTGDARAPEALASLWRTFRSNKRGHSEPVAIDSELDALSGDLLCRIFREQTGAPSAKEWILAKWDLKRPAAIWTDHLEEVTNDTVAPCCEGVATWLAAAGDAPPPAALLPFLGGLKKKDVRDAVFPQIAAALNGNPQVVAEPGGDDLGVRVEVASDEVFVPIAEMGQDFPGAFLESPDRLRLLEEVRAGIDRQRMEVTRRALEVAAKEGVAGFGEQLAAATELCRDAGRDQEHPLRGRFRAVLVDEVQDSNPDQLGFYIALCDTTPGMRARFVGDSRQSIYLFNGAEPSGLTRLVDLGGASAGKPLAQNHRSVRSLVAAQKSLFGESLTQVAQSRLLAGLESLGGLAAAHPEDGEPLPVLIAVPSDVEQLIRPEVADQNALLEFADVMKEEWKKEAVVTAAVLTPTWKLAAEASRILNAAFCDPDFPEAKAFVDGGGGWTTGRVVADLKMFLAAFLDHSDQTAWLGVWKHPMVGLSDRALALARYGQGVVRENDPGQWLAHLGWIVEADRLEAPQDEADIRAFAWARDPLRKAAAHIAWDSPADVLETLATELDWRRLLAVDPIQDALYHLDLALDWLRDMEAQGMDTREILEVLSGTAGRAEVPRLEIQRPLRHVSCTTVYQAKGLQWDCVCVLSPGKSPKGGPMGIDARSAFQEIAVDGQSYWLTPTRLDPTGGFEKARDPVDKLLSLVRRQREREEELRLAYVAVTRARRKVVMGLRGSSEDASQPTTRRSVPNLLWRAWVMPGRDLKQPILMDEPSPLGGVQLRGLAKPRTIPPVMDLYHVSCAEGAVVLGRKAARLSWRRRSPSSLYAALAPNERRALVAAVSSCALDSPEGLLLGRSEPLSAPDEGAESRVDEMTLGSMVHGWFERWRFGTGESATAEAGAQYLTEEWRCSALAAGTYGEWLSQVSHSLAANPSSPLWQLVTRDGVNLHFELPLVGVADFGAAANSLFLLSGRADLLVEEPGGLWTVIDFKAGSHSPMPGETRYKPEELAEDANLRAYAPQLEGYARAVSKAFKGDPSREDHRVVRCALWFVRTGASVMWSPIQNDR